MISATIPSFISNRVTDGKYFVSSPNQADSSEISIKCAGKESCGQAYSIDRKTFEYHAIELIVSGKCQVTMKGQTYELSAGSFFMYGPETPHSIEAVGDEPLVKYFVDVAGESVDDLFEANELAPGDLFYLNNRRWVQSIFEQLLECAELDRVSGHRLAQQLFKLLLVRLAADRQQLKTSQAYSNETFARCWDFIHNHFLEVHTMKEITSACNIDGTYLTRLFRRFAQETPYQLLTRLKISYSTDLLLSANLTVKDLGQRVGYQDPYHFSRVFKRVIGLAPTSYVEYIQRGHEGVG